MSRPLEAGTRTHTISTRLPAPSAQRIQAAAQKGNTTPAAVIRAALEALKTPELQAAVARLAPDLRRALSPVIATHGASAKRSLAAAKPVVAPIRRASASTAKQYSDPVERREIISDTCELQKDCTDDALIEAVREINRQAAAESADKSDKNGKPASPPEQLRRGAATRWGTDKPQPAVTRETLCRHLGLPGGASSHDIRRHATNVASGSRAQGSSIDRAGALSAHLGLPRGSSPDATMAIVWSLTAPPTEPNPYLTRLPAK